MKNKTIFGIGKRLMLIGLALGVLQTQSQAMIIMVYTKNNATATTDEMKSAVSWVRANLQDPSSGKALPVYPSDKLGYRVDQKSNVLNDKFSVGAGVSAYFWSDGAIDGDPTFEMHGKSMIIETAKSPIGWNSGNGTTQKNMGLLKPALMRASINGLNLNLNYVVAQAGPVSLEVFGMNGKAMGHWNWNEAASGSYNRNVGLNAIPKSNMLFVRWRSGNTQAIQKVLVNPEKK